MASRTAPTTGGAVRRTISTWGASARTPATSASRSSGYSARKTPPASTSSKISFCMSRARITALIPSASFCPPRSRISVATGSPAAATSKIKGV